VTRPFSFGENYNFNGTFDMSWANPPSLKPLGWTKSIPLLGKTKNTKISFYPTQWRWRGTFNRNISISDDANFKRVSSLQRDFDGGMDMNYRLFENLNTTYNFTTKNDLTNRENVKIGLNDFRLGLQTYYSQNFTSTYDPKLFSFIGTGLSYTTTYSDNYERTTKTRKSDLNRSWSVQGAFRHQELLSVTKKGGAGKSAGDRPMTEKERARGYRQEDLKKLKPKSKSPTDKKRNIRWVDLPFAGARYLTGWIDPIQYRYTKSYTASLPGMLQRPGWRYRFGLEDDAQVATVRESRNPDAREGESYDFQSGFKFLGGISTKVGFKRTISRDLIRVGDKSERTSTSWPDLDISIGKFKTLPLLKKPVNKIIDIFAPRTGYNRETSEDLNLSKGFVLSQTESKDYNPLLGVNFKLLRSLSLSASYSISKQEAKRFSQANGEILNHTRSTQKSVTVTTRYSFRAPGGLKLPLFGKMKITSTMNLELNVRRTLNTSESSSAGGPFQNANEKSDMMISPIISYDFSTQIKGGLTAQWQDTKDGTRKSHVRMLQIWAEIRF
jgi:hypothetical protein